MAAPAQSPASQRETAAGVSETLKARRTPEAQKQARVLLASELLWSLWAPLCVFGIAFIPYLLLIENVAGAWLWAQPLLKGFGFLMVVYFVALLALRAVPWPGKVRHQLRLDARELVAEVDRVVERAGARIDPGARAKLVEQSAAVDARWLEGDTAALAGETEALAQLSDKLLAPWKKQGAMDFVGGLVKALAVALLIRTVLIEPFKIPSGSMLPTLEIGDQVFVNKFIYGVRIPFTNYVPFQIVRAPRRGDVIVFNNPVRPSDDYIKRVVGIGGDRIEMVNQVLHINGEPQPRTLVAEDHVVFTKTYDDAWAPEHRTLFSENLTGHEHATLQKFSGDDEEETYGPLVVPEGHVFVLGDNRNDSSDSRYGLGGGSGMGWSVEYVPVGNIKGKAMVIWLALGYEGLFSGFFGGTGLRTDRLFLPVR